MLTPRRTRRRSAARSVARSVAVLSSDAPTTARAALPKAEAVEVLCLMAELQAHIAASFGLQKLAAAADTDRGLRELTDAAAEHVLRAKATREQLRARLAEAVDAEHKIAALDAEIGPLLVTLDGLLLELRELRRWAESRGFDTFPTMDHAAS